ncbi:MAG: YbhN family protein [Candidatus Nanopelagicales bacterium]
MSTQPGADDPAEDAAVPPERTEDGTAAAAAGEGTSAGLTDAEARASIGAGGIDRKKTIIGGIVAIVFLAIVFTRVIPQIGSYSEAADYVKAMTTLSIAALVAATLWYLFVYGWPFVAATPGLHYKEGFVVNQSAFAVSNGIPAGGAFGLGLQYAQLTSYQATPTVATAAIGATGLWSVFVTLFLPVTGILALTLSGEGAGSYVWGAVLGVAALVVIIGLFALILRSETNAERIGTWADKVVNGIIHRFKKDTTIDLKGQVLKLRHDIVSLVEKRWHVITISQIAVSWSQFLILYTALLGVTKDVGMPTIWVAYGCWAISQLGIMIPVTPGGLGTVDAVLIGLLTTFGVDNGAATAADLVWRAASYIPQMAIGLICIFYWRWDINHRRKKQAAAAAA